MSGELVLGIVTLIGTLGAIIISTIRGNKKTEDVKQETHEISNEIDKTVTPTVLETRKIAEKNGNGIDTLVKEVEFQQRMKNAVGNDASTLVQNNLRSTEKLGEMLAASTFLIADLKIDLQKQKNLTAEAYTEISKLKDDLKQAKEQILQMTSNLDLSVFMGKESEQELIDANKEINELKTELKNTREELNHYHPNYSNRDKGKSR